VTTSDVGQASELLSALFEGASDGLCLVAPDGTVLRANRTWLRSTGLFAEQVIGADITELFPESRDLARELHGRARRGERVPVPVHRQVILGRETWWDGTLSPVPMDGGVGLLVTAREVSHLRGAPVSDAEREWQEVLRLVIEHSPSPVALFDRELRYLAASASWVRSSGHGSDCIGRRPHDLVPELPARHLDMYRRCLAGAVEVVEEDQAVWADGTTVWFSCQCRPWRTTQGEVGGLLVQAEILNKRKEAEAAFRRAGEEMDRARLRGLDGRINEIELVMRLDGTIVHVNDRAVAAYGYARAELEGLDIRRLRKADPPALVAGQMAEAAWEGIRFEAVHVRRDGTSFPVEVSSRAFEVAGERYLHSLVRDLTEQRRAEAALRESEGRLARVLEASQDGFFDLDLSTGVSTRSDRVARMLGREPQGIPKTLEGFFALLHPEDLPGIQGEVASVLAGEHPAVERDVRASHADGSWRWLHVRARLTGPAGARRYTGAISDVTRQREGRELLVAELQRNEGLVKQLQAALQQVKTLSGLLPICMHCHQIRDDAGYWSALETYFLKHSDVMFSHALCPDCARKHYPDLGEG
jgi:PAS domain S-box-containing protein